MSKLITFAQLKACMSKIKTYVNSLTSSVATSAAEAIEELANLLLVKANLTYCTCPTSSSTVAKVATVQAGTFELKAGASVDVKFSYYNTASSPTLNVNDTGAIAIKMYGTTTPNTYMWASGAIVRFVYDGTYWIMQDKTVASTSYYGVTKLSSSTSSTSTSLAATPSAVKSAYDLANTAKTSATNHAEQSITSENGAHNLRYYNGVLQYDDNGTWKTLSISDLII